MIFIALILVCLLALSAIMAGSETALFLVARDRVALKEEEKRRGEHSSILLLLKHPNKLLMTILLGNLSVNLLFFALSTIFIFKIEEDFSASAGFAASLFFLFSVIICGEILPKTFAASAPYLFSRFSAPFLFECSRLFSWFTELLELSVRGFNRALGIDKLADAAMDQEHLRQLVDVTGIKGEIDSVSADIMEKLILLKQVRLYDVAIPRVDVKSIPLQHTVKQALEFARTNKFHTLLLYSQHHDDVAHYLDITDVLNLPHNSNSSVLSFARPLPVFPELSSLDWVLREFLEKDYSIALVVDEYGDMAGIITWELLMNKLNTQLKKMQLSSLGVGQSVLLHGRDRLGDLGILEGAAKKAESVTLGGYIAEYLDRVPKVDEVIDLESYRFTVMQATEKGIIWLRMSLKDKETKE